MDALKLAMAGMVLTGLAAVASPVAAVPPVLDRVAASIEDDRVVPVRGCHSGVKHHYVPEVGRSMRHYHRGRACKPYDADWKRKGDRRCHRDVRYHYVPEVNRHVWHYHRKKTCQPIAAERQRHPRCHRSAEIHTHRGWGKVVHRHVGSTCRVDPFRGYEDPWFNGCLGFCP